MDIRPDIAAAAARLAGGYDVERELRQLAAHLREGERVRRLAAGVYGSGDGLLAVTDHRVLLLRDGRSGQASEGFPLERVTSVRWLPGDGHGTILVGDSHTTAELSDVDPGEGAAAVALIRSMTPADDQLVEREPSTGHDTADGRGWDDDLITHNAGTARASATATAAAVSRTGPYAVRMKVRTPRDTPRGATPGTSGELPEQKSASRYPVPAQAVSRAPGSGDPTGDTARERADEAVSISGRRSRPARSDQAGAARVERSGAHAAPEPVAVAGALAGAVPVSLLVGPGAGTGTGPARFEAAAGRETDGLHGPGRPAATGGGPAASTTLVGEVPVSKLAEETGGLNAVAERRTDHPEHPAADLIANYDDPRSRTATGRTVSPDGEPTGRAARRAGGRQGEQSRRKLVLLGAGATAASVLVGFAVYGIARSVMGDSGTPVNPAPTAADSSAGQVVTVTKVLDADSIEVSGPVTGPVEILGITAPSVDRNQCGAKDSLAFATSALTGGTITLVADPAQPATDRSGRRLSSVRTQNGFDYATLAAQAGMVRYYDGGGPVARAADIKAAQEQARKADRGLWGAPCNGRLTTGSSGSSGSGADRTASSTRGGSSSDDEESSSSGGTGSATSRSVRSGTDTIPDTTVIPDTTGR
ncbi:MAG: hypothetical protein ACT4O0_21015 [Pseudonocardia sp.]